MAGVKRTLSTSSEMLGEPSAASVLSKRPTRRSAGNKLLMKGYVDTEEALRTMLEEDESDSDDEFWDSSKRKHKRGTRSKRRLSPVRDLSPTPPVQDLPLQDDEDDQNGKDGSNARDEAKPHTLSLKFYVPRGHVGPFVVNLDLASLTSSSNTSQGTESTGSITRGSLHSKSQTSTLSPHPSNRSSAAGTTGFLDLPAELRNMVYKLVLVTETPVSIRAASNFCRTAALLATCRQIHDEGTQVLYGTNTFMLDRQWHSRAPYYGKTWEEVAYKDCFRFLKTIGPMNLSLIRNLRILGEDGPRSGRTSEALRFVNDEYLIQCLKLLARHGRLQHLELSFHGKRKLKFTDHRFINHMFAVKADSVVFGPVRPSQLYSRWYYSPLNRRNSHMQEDLDAIIKERCERKTKLYPTA